FQTLLFKAQHKNNRLQLTLAKEGDYQGAPASRLMTVVVHNWTGKPNQVKVAGKPLVLYSSHQQLLPKARGGFWDPISKQLTIRFNWQGELAELAIVSSDID
ncbi:MAG: DUF5110 domain-containing protein, partial [Paraglaciecola sp.]|nr:DUF5110 domain-containing protein [Paraglaciecola sp.]